ncbi:MULTISPECIES: DeoR/GlpR family DNA-binding transcription regulator [unclassified Leisingera]|uniref:DeoR/GlpR family DNA-binding transcription regulator n=1 Tax=unclassified Leisingera TaxID=2614906 RepID=UPI0010119065|nr:MULTISPECIES: DeoR/GlpR family DNA-binding transcription regulator [unclassified Leisingera]MBQ4826039.1 DeoR/GlpR transcriptional regulator [Leisingera sp. HS039]MCF6432300.1 DeoR/GlpR family DNA-binding transcription regulator [Leisingera sp. MMG026]QAX28882.1 DeoR/GlpR transcriptional regulator [Leisingera sp. NJS204]QBR37096.1 DeoR/GlpR transcriptional regulator [Leisingera sp. NJS201]
MTKSRKTTNQREEEILRALQQAGGSCRVSYLAGRLGVSNETIRRNIRTLEDAQAVRKVHGGVHLIEDVNELPLQNRMDTHASEKQRLAIEVAKTISDGDSVFLDVGSTTAYVAQELRQRSNLFVVTNSVLVAHALASRNNNRVFLAGGELRPHDGGAFGAEALDLVRRLNVQFAIFSAGAINAEQGFMLHDLEEANLARVAAANAQVRIVVADHDKFNKRAPVSVGKDTKFEVFYTDAQPPQAVKDMLKAMDTDLIVVE